MVNRSGNNRGWGVMAGVGGCDLELDLCVLFWIRFDLRILMDLDLLILIALSENFFTFNGGKDTDY